MLCVVLLSASGWLSRTAALSSFVCEAATGELKELCGWGREGVSLGWITV